MDTKNQTGLDLLELTTEEYTKIKREVHFRKRDALDNIVPHAAMVYVRTLQVLSLLLVYILLNTRFAAIGAGVALLPELYSWFRRWQITRDFNFDTSTP